MKHPSPFVYIVLGIILVSIALAIAMPPVFGERHENHMATLSNIKQCATALMIYGADYDDRLPNAYQWMKGTYPYTQNVLLYADPWNPEAHPPTNPKIPESGLYGIAFFTPLSEAHLPDIDDPTKQILLFTSKHLGWNATSGLNTICTTVRKGSDRFYFAAADSSARSLQKSRVDMKTGELK